MGPMGHPWPALPVLSADKGLFTAALRAPLSTSRTICAMESFITTELAIVGLAFASVFILVPVLLARFDRRRP